MIMNTKEHSDLNINIEQIKKLPFDFKKLNYQRVPDPQFDISDKSILGEMYNDKMDANKNNLDFLNDFGWQNFAWGFYKLSPGKWIPPHVDHFENYARFYNITDKSKIKRALIFLEDWKPGHTFMLNNKLVLNWKAGDCYTWKHNTKHWGGNFGVEQRYTLQLTGIQN